MSAPEKPKKPKKPGKPGKRVGLAIELRPEMEERYRALHADPWKSVLERITASGIRDYTIYLGRISGRLILFSHFVYVGDDFDADMAKVAADEETQRWWKETDPCQMRLDGTPDGEQWLPLDEVFHAE